MPFISLFKKYINIFQGKETNLPPDQLLKWKMNLCICFLWDSLRLPKSKGVDLLENEYICIIGPLPLRAPFWPELTWTSRCSQVSSLKSQENICHPCSFHTNSCYGWLTQLWVFVHLWSYKSHAKQHSGLAGFAKRELLEVQQGKSVLHCS